MADERSKNTGRLQVWGEPDESDAEVLARWVMRPSVNAALTMRGFSHAVAGMELDLNALVAELAGQCKAASEGDLSRPEAMLVAQAHTLDLIFGSLAMRSCRNMGEYTDAADRYMRLALKAQSQCRATIETLAAIKNPPTVIARQANIAHGPQQVNNGEPSCARKIQSEQSKLLEQTNGERLDTGAAGQAIGSDPKMATVGTVHRPKNGGR